MNHLLTSAFIDSVNTNSLIHNHQYIHTLFNYHIDLYHLEHRRDTRYTCNYIRSQGNSVIVVVIIILSALNFVDIIMVSNTRGIRDDSHWPSQDFDSHTYSATG